MNVTSSMWLGFSLWMLGLAMHEGLDEPYFGDLIPSLCNGGGQVGLCIIAVAVSDSMGTSSDIMLAGIWISTECIGER